MTEGLEAFLSDDDRIGLGEAKVVFKAGRGAAATSSAPSKSTTTSGGGMMGTGGSGGVLATLYGHTR